MTGELAAAHRSGAQRARVVTEAWGENNLFCPNCSSPKLTWLEPGHPASDYSCPKCKFWFQLKSQKSRIGDSITNGAYSAMMEAIQKDEAPSYYFLQYDLATWSVRNLLLVPHFAFPPSAIIKRKPLSVTARRAGWVGCNFALSRIPADARIPLVITRSSGRESAPFNQSRLTSAATVIVPPEEVREKFKRVAGPSWRRMCS
jgi:type II restriction enzyme